MMAKVQNGTKPALADRAADKLPSVLNLKTAKVFGMPIPTSVPLRVGEVIEYFSRTAARDKPVHSC
jgi:hypothetical protein